MRNLKTFFATLFYGLAISASAFAQPFNVGPGSIPPGQTISSFVPTMTFATVGDLSISYTTQYFEYNYSPATNELCFQENLVFTPTYTTASGAARFALPIAGKSAVQSVLALPVSSLTWPAGYTEISGSISSSAAYFTLLAIGTAATPTTFTSTQFTSGVQYTVRAGGCYFTG